MKPLKSNREMSFGAFVDRGASPSEIMTHFSLSESEYERKLASLQQLRERAAEKKKGAGAR